MARSQRAACLLGAVPLAAVLFAAFGAAGPSIPIDYCATINTATTNANTSIYQTEGLCTDFCRGRAALAVVHDQSCWCADYVPDQGSQVSIGQCNSSCPGFPSDLCGGNGLFGYLIVGTPTATKSTGQTASSSGQLDNNAQMTTLAPTVQTVTTGGTTKTLTVTPTIPVSALNQSEGSSSGLGTGAVVGIVVGVIFAILGLVGIGAFIYIRRRRRQQQDGTFDPSSIRGSSAGMMNTPRTEMSTENRLAGGTGSAGETSETDALGRRRSRLMPVDPRMDPFVYNREGNKSHDSIHTMRDDQDYSRRVHETPRVLRATNPDPSD